MAERANFEIYKGTSVVLRFQLVTPEPYPDYVTGWSTRLYVREKNNDANTILSVAGAISTVSNALKYGIFDVSLSAANTTLLTDDKKYAWSFRRTNAGFEDVLAYGEITARNIP
jgi:hypothetical protein